VTEIHPTTFVRLYFCNNNNNNNFTLNMAATAAETCWWEFSE